MSKATIKDVALKAGISETTVSLAFKAKSRISQKTRDKVLSIASELNYIPNLAAKNLRSGGSKTIAFIVNDITNPFYSLMLKEAEEIALEHDFSIIFAGSNWSAEKEKHLFEQMVQMRVCGVIMCLCEKSSSSLDILNRFHIPYIAVDSYPNWYQGAYVANDFNQAGKLAALHLLEQGCEKPAYFTATEAMKTFSAFYKTQSSFCDTFRANGVNFSNTNIIESGLNIQAGRNSFEKLISNQNDLDSAFCANDLCAMGVMEGAEQHGMTPGEHLAIIGIDDIEVSSFSRISLTSIRQPYKQIAKIATEELIKAVKAKTTPDIKVELPAELVIRNSSKIDKSKD